MDLKSLIEKLTLEEKLQLLTGKNNWETVAVERLGIPSILYRTALMAFAKW